MEVVIVTGLSGAGKTQTIKILEDIGFFCVDNMLPELLEQFVNIYMQKQTKLKQIAVGIDIRTTECFDKLLQVIFNNSNGVKYKVIFLDSSDEVLVRRYKENRRLHPLAGERRIIDGITEEREKLAELRQRADYIIDTSTLLVRELREEIVNIFSHKDSKGNMLINVLSFGFKYGVPNDVDMIFDARFLPNPFYIENLRTKTGNDKEVYDYVLSFKETKEFIDKIDDLLKFLVPGYIKEGKSQLVIGIGCTGGQHRSVTIARVLYGLLKEEGCNVVLQHREIKE